MAIEKLMPDMKDMLRNDRKFHNYSLGQSFTLNYEFKTHTTGTYKVICNTDPELSIESEKMFTMVVDNVSQAHPYSFQFNCSQPVDYIIIVSVQPEAVIEAWNSGGNHVLYFRLDEKGGRLLNAFVMFYKDKIKVWQKHHDLDPLVLNSLSYTAFINTET